MPRTSSKKGQPNSTTSTTSSAVDLFRSASGKAANKELERIDQLFNSYANNSSGMIDPEGIESLCSDLEVEHTDVRILMLAWKMQAEKQGYFTMEEWRRALKALRADTIIKLKKSLPELEKEVKRPSNYVEFYSFAFQYCLTEEKQKSIDIESICELLELVLGSQFRAQVDSFVQYLRLSCLTSCFQLLAIIIKLVDIKPQGGSYSSFTTQIDYKVINMDQWMGFYRFCNEISYPELSNYDEELAWPLILDNFVEWVRSKQK